MRILKHGDLKPRKFICPNCGCVFVADRTEYQKNSGGGVIKCGTTCPDCEYYLFVDGDQAPLFNEEQENESKDNY